MISLPRSVDRPLRWVRSFRPDPYLLLLFTLTTFALIPLLADGYFYSAHDGRHSVFFTSMFNEAIRDGALWPRWAMHHNQGYGYPTFVVQAPLAFYTAQFFMLFGAGVTLAVKFTWAVGFYAGAWGMYALIRHWTMRADPQSAPQNSHLAALIAGLLYVYVPYHLLDIYVRAALAETMLFAWFPWVFLAFDRLIIHGAKPGWAGRLLVAALTYAGTLLTHVLALPAFTPLLVAFVLFRCVWLLAGGEKNLAPHALRLTHYYSLLLSAAAGIAALLLAAIFILPLLVEGPLLDQSVFTENTYDYGRHFLYWGQYFNPFWGYGFSDDPSGVRDGMGFQVGVVPLILGVSGIFWLAKEGRNRDEIWWLIAFCLGASVAVMAAMTPLAAPIWGAVSLLEVVQFPWRLMALVSFTMSGLGGLLIWQISQQTQEAPASLLAVGLVIVLASAGYARPQSVEPVEAWREDGRAVFQFEREHPDMLGYTQWVTERFTQSPLTAQYKQDALDGPLLDLDNFDRLGILAGEGTVLSQYSRGHTFGGEVAMPSPGTVEIRVYAFPGWQVTVDGEPVDTGISSPHGLLTVDVNAGTHRIHARMGLTPVRTAGIAISAGTLLLLVGIYWLSRRRSSPVSG